MPIIVDLDAWFSIFTNAQPFLARLKGDEQERTDAEGEGRPLDGRGFPCIREPACKA